MPTKDKELIKLYRRRWYKKNSKKQIARQLKRRRELKKWLLKYKEELTCAICGMSFKGKPECCDFHHTEDNKKDNMIALIISSKKAALREIKKCIPVCANCHRTIHFKKEM